MEKGEIFNFDILNIYKNMNIYQDILFSCE